MSSLNVTITSEEKGLLYNLKIDNTQLDETKSIGSYAATLSGVGLELPLAVKLRKFNRGLGSVKLTSRVLGRLFRKHMDKLAINSGRGSTATRTRTRAKAASKGAKEAKEAKELKEKETKGAPAPVAAAPAPAPTPAPAPAVAAAAPEPAFQV